jgi:capsular polysaccharide transport system permease protein
MTMKLRVSRFRTRRPEPFVGTPRVSPRHAAASPTASRPAPQPAPAAVTPDAADLTPPPASFHRSMASAQPEIGDNAFFPAADSDGFGAMSFATARGHAAAPATSLTPPASAIAMTLDGASPSELDSIRREGLTGRQLRMARRMAQKHGLPATSDFDAVRLLRRAGIDPFGRSSVLELVAADEGGEENAADPSRALVVTPDMPRLPQVMKPMQLPSTEVRVEQSHVAEVARIQQDMARRRRRKLVLLVSRLSMFVFLPTILAGWYFFFVATPLYATKSEFLIQQAEPAAQAGLGGLLRGSPMVTAQDSMAVQGYLQSSEAMERLDADQNFRAHFSDPAIDPIQRLDPDASNTKAHALYRKMVRISYDPTEGVIKMEVTATDAQTSVAFSEALIRYAEEQVDQLTQRLREDQMEGALESFAEAEAKMLEAQRRVVELQEKYKTISSEVEVSLITSQIGSLETQLSQDQLSLAQMESNASPNAARMEPLKRRIATLTEQIAALRNRLTEDGEGGLSVAKVQSELLVAQADVSTRQLLLAQSLSAMESARVEANRQTRYLSLSVHPVAPDDPSYPRAFENTLVVMLIFAGIYLMISMTIAILREQVTG